MKEVKNATNNPQVDRENAPIHLGRLKKENPGVDELLVHRDSLIRMAHPFMAFSPLGQVHISRCQR